MTNFDFGVTFGKSEAPAAFGDMLAVRVENKRRQDYDAKKTAFEAQQKTAADNSKFVDENFKMSNLLTGNPQFDPFIIKRQPEIVQFATDFLMKNPNASRAQLQQTLNPYIAELATYKQRAQEYSTNKKQLVEELKNVKGINADRAGSILDEHMLKNTGNVADMKTDIDSLRSALQGREKDLVVGDEGLKSVLDGQGKGVVAKMVKTRDGSGRTVSTEKKYNLPTFATIGDDGQPTVKAETFSLNTPPSAQKTIVNGRELDSNQKIAAQTYLQDVMSTNGNIQLMEEGTFNQLMQDRSFAANIAAATQAYMDDYEQQNKEKFPRGTVSELMLQRAVAFNKASQYLNSNVLDKQTTSQPIVINNSGGGGNKNEKDEVPVINLYGELKTVFDNLPSLSNIPGLPNIGAPKMISLNDPNLSGDLQENILGIARERKGKKEDVLAEQFMIVADKNGKYMLYEIGANNNPPKFISNLDERFLNKGAQVNVAGKQAVLKNSNNNNPSPKKGKPY